VPAPCFTAADSGYRVDEAEGIYQAGRPVCLAATPSLAGGRTPTKRRLTI
jgi:hypothetical protein